MDEVEFIILNTSNPNIRIFSSFFSLYATDILYF